MAIRRDATGVVLQGKLFLLAFVGSLLSSCSSLSTSPTPIERLNVLDGFHAFAGNCMARARGQVSAGLLPLIENLVSGGLKAGGTVLTNAGKESTVTHAASINIHGTALSLDCIQLVHGPVYVSEHAYSMDKTPFEDKLPLPWRTLASDKANTKPANEAHVDPAEVIKRARGSLAANKLWLAGRPRFFAELSVVPAQDGTAVSFRMRALYYGSPIQSNWFGRNAAKRVVITLGPLAAEKSIEDNIKNGYSVDLQRLPIGSAVLFDDMYRADLEDRATTAWDAPWYRLVPVDSTQPSMLFASVQETRAGSTFLTFLGEALTASATATGTAVKDSLDPVKAAKEKEEEQTARVAAAERVQKAVDSVKEARAAHRACTDALAAASDSNPFDEDLYLTFLAKKAMAEAAIVNAKPLVTVEVLGAQFLESSAAKPNKCWLPT